MCHDKRRVTAVVVALEGPVVGVDLLVVVELVLVAHGQAANVTDLRAQLGLELFHRRTRLQSVAGPVVIRKKRR
jgi:hypothetical protein